MILLYRSTMLLNKSLCFKYRTMFCNVFFTIHIISNIIFTVKKIKPIAAHICKNELCKFPSSKISLGSAPATKLITLLVELQRNVPQILLLPLFYIVALYFFVEIIILKRPIHGLLADGNSPNITPSIRIKTIYYKLSKVFIAQ